MSRTESGFHNPYNFVPFCDPISKDRRREAEVAAQDAHAGQLEQGKPPGHHVYRHGLYEGRIEVELTAASPLLLLDPSKTRVDKNDHKTVDLLTDAQGKPILRPTSLKGALRSAYEAITCSRLGVFHGHDRPLARRMAARDGLAMVPARISDTGDELELYLGRHVHFPVWHRERWNVPCTEMYAAWLPRYWSGRTNRKGPVFDRNAVKYPKGSHPKHGDCVDCWLKLVTHRSKRFKFWRVVYIKPSASFAPLPTEQAVRSGDTTAEYLQIKGGYVCITNQNNGKKHDERVFFSSPSPKPTKTIPLEKQWRTAWKYLTEDYQREHEGEIKTREKSGAKAEAYLGHKPGETAWSQHVIDKRATELKPSDLCYARVDSKGEIVGLYPVMISRELATKAPSGLIPQGIRPAEQLDELSPADRVFGWVRQGSGETPGAAGRSAYKGHVRVRSVTCCSSACKAIHRFNRQGLPLAILSTPKPQQALFYAAGKQNYDGAKSLSGRKFYLHHRDISRDYWSPHRAIANATSDSNAQRSNGGLFREYVRLKSKDQRNNQNQSILAWVKEGTKFKAEIRFDNLNEAELGALLWLCDLGAVRHLRVGAGKPLGFGSVTSKVADVEIRCHQAMKAEYAALVPTSEAVAVAGVLTCAESACDNFVPEFEKALCGTGGALKKHPAVAAFLAMAEGPTSGPVHYPRKSKVPDAKGENYKWFGSNQGPLPTPGKELPYLIDRPSARSSHQHARRSRNPNRRTQR